MTSRCRAEPPCNFVTGPQSPICHQYKMAPESSLSTETASYAGYFIIGSENVIDNSHINIHVYTPAVRDNETDIQIRCQIPFASFIFSTCRLYFSFFNLTSVIFFLSSGSVVNPFTPESDQCQITPPAPPEILHHTVRRTWLFIGYSDERRF